MEKKTPEKLKPRPQLDSDYVPPGNQMEQALVNMWAEFFGYEEVGIRDDFFEMGGDSLKALIILPKIHKELQVEIPITEFFNRPTIEKISGYIDGAEKDSYYSIEPVEKREYYPLSSAQERLFILMQMAPTSAAYNESLLEVFEGNPEKAILEEIFAKLIKRHESLRTSFELLQGESIQRIHREIDFKIEYFDSRINQGEVREGKGTSAVIRNIRNFIRPFELAAAPLLRVGLIQPGKEKYLLLVDMHHIISDGISIDLIINDVKALYDEKELPQLRIQYKDYIQWQNSKRVQERIMRQQGYWLNRFEGHIPVLNLPTDFTRPPEQDYEGKTRRFKLSRQQTQQLKLSIAKEYATLFMKLAAIFYVFLFKISGQEDIVVGTPIAGRQHSDLENIIGMFANTLAMRNYPKPGKTYDKFLKEVKERTLEDFQHQDYPFEKLIDQLNVDRDISRNPVFDVMFILHTMETREEIEKSYNYEKNAARFDLTLQAFEAGENLFFRFEYCTKLFKEETIERFIGYFKSIVASISHRPHQELWEIEIISEKEKNRILYEFNDTVAQYPKDKTIRQIFAEQVEKTPDQVAIVGPYVSRGAINESPIQITYRQLNQESDRLALYLRSKGMVSGSIAGILVERSAQMMVALLGILKAGGAYLPLDPEYPEARLKYIIEKSGACILLTQQNLIYKSKGTSFAGKTIDIFAEEFYGEHGLPGEEKEKPAKKEVPTEPAYVIYTSGSTGNPKGVVITHQNAVNFISAMTKRIRFSTGKTIAALTTISFDIFFLETFLPLTRGLIVVIADERRQQDPMLLRDVITANHVDMLQVTPSRLKLLLSAADQGKFLEGVETLIVGGEAFPIHLLEQVKERFGGNIYNVYGPTETTIWSTVKDLTRCPSGELTIGTPIANTQVYILDSHFHLQPPGVPGELSIGGDGVASGYLNNPQLTGEKFIFNRYYRSHRSNRSYFSRKIYKTGDLARWLPDREIQFLGRVDHQVKIRGFRIELEEIEEQLVKHEQIKEAVVISRKNKNGDDYLAAYLVPAPQQENTTETLSVPALREYLSGGLPDYMIPSYFVHLEQMPVTPNGKIHRKALPEPTDYRPQMDIVYLEPESETEKVMTRIWQEELGLEKIGVNDNFFDLGGNSMAVVRLVNRLNREFNRNIPVVSIFKFRTIRAFSGYWTQKEDTELSIEDRAEALKRGDQTRRKRVEMIRGSMS